MRFAGSTAMQALGAGALGAISAQAIASRLNQVDPDALLRARFIAPGQFGELSPEELERIQNDPAVREDIREAMETMEFDPGLALIGAEMDVRQATTDANQRSLSPWPAVLGGVGLASLAAGLPRRSDPHQIPIALLPPSGGRPFQGGPWRR